MLSFLFPVLLLMFVLLREQLSVSSAILVPYYLTPSVLSCSVDFLFLQARLLETFG